MGDLSELQDLARGMTPQQHRFALAVAGGMNQTKAYRHAGYAASTDNAAATGASKLVRDPKVHAYIARKVEEACAIGEVTLANRIVALAKTVDSMVDEDTKLRGHELLFDQLKYLTPADSDQIVLPEHYSEAAFAQRAAAVIDLMLAGTLPAQQVLVMLEAIKLACEVAHAATLAAELRGEPAMRDVTSAQDPAPPVRPKWLGPPGSNGKPNGHS